MGRHEDLDGDGVADFAAAEAAAAAGLTSAPDHHVADAVEATGYVYTDPVADEAFPNISASDPDDVPDVFPENWAAAPTERDQAAIDAGNA